ncbi:hypothetical protein EVAR_24870_1 [Eumeta japonica]|uniref:Uncharacterized protein n=1 Tax=Eumeta variegata TaxID=151549 RepID=A0A4C1YBR8_EUMVA|nr:hypothetical protein EVAR_24870_1 [Eumeta japonica]
MARKFLPVVFAAAYVVPTTGRLVWIWEIGQSGLLVLLQELSTAVIMSAKARVFGLLEELSIEALSFVAEEAERSRSSCDHREVVQLGRWIAEKKYTLGSGGITRCASGSLVIRKSFSPNVNEPSVRGIMLDIPSPGQSRRKVASEILLSLYDQIEHRRSILVYLLEGRTYSARKFSQLRSGNNGGLSPQEIYEFPTSLALPPPACSKTT